MSAVWQVEAKKAMHSSPRKIGEQIVTSLRWPDVSQGSFVIKTSPGRSVSSGHAARKCFIASAMELMCPGVPVTAWATMKPQRSKTPAERSPASRTIEVKDVRWSAAACSLTTPTRRLPPIPREIGVGGEGGGGTAVVGGGLGGARRRGPT